MPLPKPKLSHKKSLSYDLVQDADDANPESINIGSWEVPADISGIQQRLNSDQSSLLNLSSLSTTNDSIAVMLHSNLYVFKKDVDKYVMNGQILLEEDIETTVIQCLPVFKTGGSEDCVLVGCSSGQIRIYNLYCHLLFVHQPHSSQLISVKISHEEEVILLYSDKVIVSLEGTSFAIATKTMQSDVISFKKFTLSPNQNVSDVISLGKILLI